VTEIWERRISTKFCVKIDTSVGETLSLLTLAYDEYCDVFGRMLSLLGNGKFKTSMDMLDSPTVSDGCMATKNGRPQQ
jgi:hypothetical protein